ncbi:MAG: hypothetical protein RLZZ127_2029 [Planctomycetota bacterium]
MTRPVPRCDPALAPAELADRLPAEVVRLVLAVRGLYAGNFADCAEDLRRRRAGRPYLFRLDIDLSDDLAWLAALDAYEAVHGRGAIAAAVADPVPLV